MAPSQNVNMKVFVAFGLIGFVNTVLPLVILSAHYLIIPHARSTVITIQTLPALAVKLIYPHLLRYLSWRTSSWIFASCWVLTAIGTQLIAPNVPPLPRILITMLASATASATEVYCTSQLVKHGESALSGWGFGTGSGAVASAVLPYIWTTWLGHRLRNAVGYTYYLAAILPLTGLFLIPTLSASTARVRPTKSVDKFDDEDGGASASGSLLSQDPLERTPTFSSQVQRNILSLRKMIRPYMLPLYSALVTQTILIPGMTRAYPAVNDFADFESFFAAYALAFQLGVLVSRSSITLVQFHRVEILQRTFTVVAIAVILNASYGFVTTSTILFILLFSGGLFSGAIYINVFRLALQNDSRDLNDADEFNLGVIGAGETAGIWVGSLLGCALERRLCAGEFALLSRWCSKNSS